MKFELTLRSEEDYSVHTDSFHFGTSGIDKIRDELKTNLMIERINNYVEWFQQDPLIEVPENLARKSGQFIESSRLRVECPVKWGNQFLKQVVSSKIDDATGEIKSATLKWQFDKDRFLRWWEDNDFPTEIEKD